MDNGYHDFGVSIGYEARGCSSESHHEFQPVFILIYGFSIILIYSGLNFAAAWINCSSLTYFSELNLARPFLPSFAFSSWKTTSASY